MENQNSFLLSFFTVAIIVNILAVIVLFLYQRRKHRYIKIVLLNLFIIQVLFSINQITVVFIPSAKADKIIAGSRDVTAFLLLVHALNLEIMAFQCLVNSTSVLRSRLEKRMQNISILSVLCSWLFSVLIALPLIFLQVSEGDKSNDSKQLNAYFQGILLLVLVKILLILVADIYIAYRTWIKVDINNIISFSVNKKNVTMTIMATISYVLSTLPYMCHYLQMQVNTVFVAYALWLDKISLPLLFVFIYAAKHFYNVVKRAVISRRQHQDFRQIQNNNNNKVTVINSFTHVQHAAASAHDDEEERVTPCSPDNVILSRSDDDSLAEGEGDESNVSYV